jgi:hypothetical protein
LQQRFTPAMGELEREAACRGWQDAMRRTLSQPR